MPTESTVESRDSRALIWVIVAVVLVIFVAAAILLANNNAGTNPNSNTNTSTTSTSRTSTVSTSLTTTSTSAAERSFDLTEQNASGQNGTVLLEEVGAQVRVTITLSNPTSVSEPAHIHEGSCPTPGSVVYPLQNVVNGTSVTLLDTSLADLEAMGALAVNVHKSAAESSVYVSCGNLDF